jgi:hypothetical protein
MDRIKERERPQVALAAYRTTGSCRKITASRRPAAAGQSFDRLRTDGTGSIRFDPERIQLLMANPDPVMDVTLF